MFLRKLTSGLLFIGLVVLLAACGNDDSEPIAIVNGEEIPTYRFNEQVDRMKSGYEQQGIDFDSEDGAQFLAMIEQQAINTLIQQTVLIQGAEEAGIELDEASVDDAYAGIRNQFDSEEMFEEALEANGFTEDSLREMIYVELKIEKFFDASVDDVDVSDADIEEYYADYEEQMEQHDQEAEALEDIWDEIEAQIIQERQHEQFNEVVDTLMEQSEIENFLDENDDE